MKQFTLLMCVFSLCFGTFLDLCAQTVFNGDALLTSQQEVDNFGANGFTEITGRLIIQSTTDQITDLSPLSTLERLATSSPVTGFDDALTIRDNNELLSLAGLNALFEIQGGMLIENNIALINLEGLEGVGILNALSTEMLIQSNTSLTSLDGLENVVFPLGGSIEIIENTALTSVTALTNVRPTNYLIQDNPVLASLEGINFGNNGLGLDIINNDALEVISLITGTLQRGITLSNNDNLSDLSGLSGIAFQSPIPIVEIEVINNDSLATLTGLPTNLASVVSIRLMENNLLSDISLLENFTAGILRIINNESLTSITSLINFTNGQLFIQGNNLTSLDGLQSFTNIAQLDIIDTDLVSLNGLNPNITSIENRLNLENNPNLTLPLTEFQNLENIGNNAPVTDFRIINCDAIYSLEDFSNLTSINADIEFSGNDTLFDFCGIQTALNNGFSRGYNVNTNSFNPGLSDVMNGNCMNASGDIDMDGVEDGSDNCPLTVNADQADLDSDGFGNVCDTDIDGDGFSNEEENNCGSDPFDANSFCMLITFYEDADMDELGDPNVSVEEFQAPDGFVDNDDDLCPNDFDPSNANFDGDDEGDVCDDDDDNDGFSDEEEEECGSDPFDPDETCETLFIQENTLNTGINVYPNPVKNILHIDNASTLPISSISIFNIEGQILIRIFDVDKEIDMTSFPSGIYFLEMIVGDRGIVKKVVK